MSPHGSTSESALLTDLQQFVHVGAIYVIRPRACADIGLNELFGISSRKDVSRCGEHCAFASSQAIHDRLANSFRAACDEDSLAGEFVGVVWEPLLDPIWPLQAMEHHRRGRDRAGELRRGPRTTRPLELRRRRMHWIYGQEPALADIDHIQLRHCCNPQRRTRGIQPGYDVSVQLWQNVLRLGPRL